MKIITVRDIESFAKTIVPKPSQANKKKIESILLDVKKNGDKAIKKYERKFGANLRSLRVTAKEIKESYSQVSKNEKTAINQAKNQLIKNEIKLKNQVALSGTSA